MSNTISIEEPRVTEVEDVEEYIDEIVKNKNQNVSADDTAVVDDAIVDSNSDDEPKYDTVLQRAVLTGNAQDILLEMDKFMTGITKESKTHCFTYLNETSPRADFMELALNVIVLVNNDAAELIKPVFAMFYSSLGFTVSSILQTFMIEILLNSEKTPEEILNFMKKYLKMVEHNNPAQSDIKA